MSKSVKRVREALIKAGLEDTIREMSGQTRTAADAALEIGCELDQIAKSIIFRSSETGQAVLCVTAGGNMVDSEKAAAAAGERLERADAAFGRETTGFVIGGVAPIGHVSRSMVFFDPKLLEFTVVHAAAGTPRHIFSVSPTELLRITDAQPTDFIT